MIPQRIKRETGRYALVDGIPFHLPIEGKNSPAMMVIYTIDADKAQALMPGDELHVLRLGRRGLLIITVLDYLDTIIGKYIEFSIGIACTHGPKQPPPLLPAFLLKPYGTGQYVYDLPVSTEISVKGGRSIWGMPKRQANLNYVITNQTVSSQYDLDGQLVMKIEIDRPKSIWLPLNMSAVSYSQFRGMLMKAEVHFNARLGFSLLKKGSARLTLGDHPRAQPLKDLRIGRNPLFTGFFPSATGILDDHVETWFLSYEQPPKEVPEGMESVINLGLSQEWLTPPTAPVPQSVK